LSELLKSADMVMNPLLGIEFIKVVSTEVFVGFVVPQNEINRNQDAVFNRQSPVFFHDDQPDDDTVL
jgi:hypothetical protein